MLENLFYGFGILSFFLYILIHIPEPVKYLKEKFVLWRSSKLPVSPPTWDDLPSVFRAPTKGSNKEAAPFDDFDKYKDDLFDDNPPNAKGIYGIEKELETDDDPYYGDIYETEVSR